MISIPRFGHDVQRIALLLTLPMALGVPVLAQGQGKCPVCGMFSGNFPDWECTITFQGGSSVSFDGPKDLFTYLTHLKKYSPSRASKDIRSVMVKDYYSLKAVDGMKCFFVLGSDTHGPMGLELVPLLSRSDAEAFLKEHKGKRILSFSEITPAILATLD